VAKKRTLDADSENQDPLYRSRHSLAHVMAHAVLDLRPGSKRGFGPPIDTGFYYDFILSSPLAPEDFPKIEERMREIIKQDHTFKREDLPVEAAYQRLAEMGEPYKLEYAKELVSKYNLQTLSFYTSGSFVDMCEGPHVNHTGELKPDVFRLQSLAGAYWRGDERNPMMLRIYAWAFLTPEELKKHIERYEAAQQFDHKKIGPQLDLYTLDPAVGRGLPLWMPNGTVLRDELENLAKEEEFRGGYVRVSTPHITRGELYEQSGHLSHYVDKMYPAMHVKEHDTDEKDQETYYLKPMNCPHHHRIFAARKRSYRELPLRMAEFGHVYRFEASGEVSGLLRVRGMTQNDGHIYCRPDQLKSELKAGLELQRKYYKLFGLDEYYMRLSLWNPDDPHSRAKYVDEPELWEQSQRVMREVLQELDVPFTEAEGEAAFYGPKIDFQFKSVTGREETFSTIQLDFAIPRADRMNLTYTGPDGLPAHPFVIHRAPLGSHERFIAYLIEHYRGAFPTWLAPVQAVVLPVSEQVHEYGHKVLAELRNRLVRAELDDDSNSISKRIRTALTRKVPYLVVAGKREAESGAVTLRRYGSDQQQVVPLEQFLSDITQEIAERRPSPKPDPEAAKPAGNKAPGDKAQKAN
jgi:threonyl-tRNA synthetase